MSGNYSGATAAAGGMNPARKKSKAQNTSSVFKRRYGLIFFSDNNDASCYWNYNDVLSQLCVGVK